MVFCRPRGARGFAVVVNTISLNTTLAQRNRLLLYRWRQNCLFRISFRSNPYIDTVRSLAGIVVQEK